MSANRYRLIGGEVIWIVDDWFPERNPLFVIQAHDGKFAREFLSNLNAIDTGHVETMRSTAREAGMTHISGPVADELERLRNSR